MSDYLRPKYFAVQPNSIQASQKSSDVKPNSSLKSLKSGNQEDYAPVDYGAAYYMQNMSSVVNRSQEDFIGRRVYQGVRPEAIQQINEFNREMVGLSNYSISQQIERERDPEKISGLQEDLALFSDIPAQTTARLEGPIEDGFRYFGMSQKFEIDQDGRLHFRDPHEEGVLNSGESILVDRQRDPALQEAITDFNSRLEEKASEKGAPLEETEKAQELALYLRTIFHAPNDRTIINPAGNEIGANGNDLPTNRDVLLGEFITGGEGVREGSGACRHKALMAQVLGESCGLEMTMVVGNYKGGHVWSEIGLQNGNRLLLDVNNRYPVMNAETQESYRIIEGENPFELVSEELVAEELSQYRGRDDQPLY